MDSITLKKGNDLSRRQKELKDKIERVRTALVDKSADTLKILKNGGGILITITDCKELIKSTLELMLATTEKEYFETSRQLLAL